MAVDSILNSPFDSGIFHLDDAGLLVVVVGPAGEATGEEEAARKRDRVDGIGVVGEKDGRDLEQRRRVRERGRRG